MTAVERIVFSLIRQIVLTPEDKYLAANLAPAAVVALVDELEIGTLSAEVIVRSSAM